MYFIANNRYALYPALTMNWTVCTFSINVRHMYEIDNEKSRKSMVNDVFVYLYFQDLESSIK